MFSSSYTGIIASGFFGFNKMSISNYVIFHMKKGTRNMRIPF